MDIIQVLLIAAAIVVTMTGSTLALRSGGNPRRLAGAALLTALPIGAFYHLLGPAGIVIWLTVGAAPALARLPRRTRRG